MVKVGRTKTRLHSDLAERDTHSQSHPALYIEGGLGIKNIATVYDSRNAAGDQVITGVGFVPKVVIILARATGGTYQIASIGFSDGINDRCLAFLGNSVDTTTVADRLVYCIRAAGESLVAVLKSFDADGFTLTWSLSGAVTVYFTALCFE